MTRGKKIVTAHSCEKDARLAVREFYASVSECDPGFIVFFCSSYYDLPLLAETFKATFPNIPAIGCTTAGEIGPAGLRKHSLSGIAFPSEACKAVVGCINQLGDFSLDRVNVLVGSMKLELDKKLLPTAGKRFALEFIDGLSNREEVVMHALLSELGDVPVFGGSAGDDLRIEHTWTYCDGRFHNNAMVLALVETSYPFSIFRTHHFVGGEERMVVTEVDVAGRTVKEINGLPAAQEYARVLGLKPELLHSGYFSESPVVVRINGADYVRSIRSANPDGSLTFYCAIERGVILRVAHAEDLVANLSRTFASVRDQVGAPQAVIACDCIFRSMEFTNDGHEAAVRDLYHDNHVVGFNSYGEQFMGLHLNQTLTGIAIGYPVDAHNA